jgi:hypothetical protein
MKDDQAISQNPTDNDEGKMPGNFPFFSQKI